MNIEDLYQISGENGLVTKLEKVKFSPFLTADETIKEE